MKDDYSQLKKNTSNVNQSDNSSSVNDDSLDWAKQAYLQLKQKQNQKTEIIQKEINEKQILNSKNNMYEDSKLNISVDNTLQVTQDLKGEDELKLGDFDDTFTWSAEVLAAQGKKLINFH